MNRRTWENKRTGRSIAGLTTIELLVAIAMIGILAAIAAPSFRTPPARLAANSMAAVARQARFEAIKVNRPMIVTIGSGTPELLVHESDNAETFDCNVSGRTELRSVDLSEYRGAHISSGLTQFVWLPNGQLRECSGATVFSDLEVTIDATASSATLVVGAGGEVGVL